MCGPHANSGQNLALGWEGAKEVCRCHLSLVLNSGRRPAVVVKILSRRALGTGQRAEETQKILVKKMEQPIKKKEIMGALKKKTWAAHGRRTQEIKKKNMGV